MSIPLKIKWNHFGKIRILNLREQTFDALISAVKSTKVDEFCHELSYIDDANDKIMVECDSSMGNFLEYFESKGTQPLIYTRNDEETIKLAISKCEFLSPTKTNSSSSIMDYGQRQENNSFAFSLQSPTSNIASQATSDSSQIQKQLGQLELEPIKEKIYRLALHPSFGFVGNYYNAKLDQFIMEVQLERFKQLETIENQSKECLYVIGMLEEFNDRFDRLQFDVDQKLSILSNLTETQSNGFGKFFTTIFVGDILEECRDKAFGMVRIWHKKLCKLNLTDPTIRTQVISQQPYQYATHVVKTVIYGFAVAAVFIPSNNDVKMEELKKAVHSILRSPDSATNSQNRNKNILKNAGNSVKVQIFADSQLAIPDYISLNDAIELLALKCPFDCAPLPIQYEMVSITLLMKKSYLKTSNFFPIQIHDPSFIGAFHFNVQAIKYIDLFYTKMADFMQKYPYCFSKELFSSFGEKCANAKSSQQKYYQDLQKCLTFYRNKMEMDKLEHYNELLEEQQKISTMIYEMQPLFRKIKLAELLKKIGALYLGNGNFHLEKALGKCGQKACFVYFCSGDDDLAQNSPNQQLFFQLIERGEQCIFVDMELVDWAESRKTSIAKYRNGQETVEDYLKEEERKLNCCVAKIQNLAEQIDENIYAPKNLVHFECTCPKASKFGGNCSDEEFLWECDDCGQFLAISNQNQTNQLRHHLTDYLVDYFYCQCGRTRVEEIQFRCKYRDQHGNEFVPFPSETLGSIFGQFNFGEKNILILGESGVGKSTWINALTNYMAYRNIDDALQMDNPICLIPSKFTIADEKMNPKLIQIGQIDENGDEILEIGKSATKRPKAHIFPYKGGKIRLIDTPGIGDTEGIEEDKANFASTLSYIANFEELHGICILLKPNNARLSLIFRYCVNELLTHLHKNAARNIIFCFTNTRGTLFKPGDTLSSLRALLDQMEQNQGVRIELNPNTVFCMDNEAFRFICAVHNNIKFDEKDHANFADSWRRSEAETNRLLARINCLPPHTAKETVSLNEARRIITTLSQPIAIIAKIIQDNITTMADEKKRLAKLTETEEDFQKKLMTPFTYIKYDILRFPQTICASQNCTEMRIGPNGKPHIFYKTVCHDVCFLNGSTENRFPNQQLRWCMIFKASNGLNCCKCGCPWSIHMNTRYKQMECTEMVEDPNVKKWLEEGKDKKAAIQMAIKGASEQVKLFEAEQQKINEIAARFGAFLKRHALMPYNDAIEAYVELAIRDARQIAEKTKDFQKVEGLKEYLRIYKEQGRIIDESLKHGTEEIKLEDVKRYFEELISLKLMGKNIKQLFDAETIVQKKQMAYLENSYIPPPILRRATSNANIRTILSPKSPEFSRKETEKFASPPNEYEKLLSPDKRLFIDENLAKTPQKEQNKSNGENDKMNEKEMVIIRKLTKVSDPRRSREKATEKNVAGEEGQMAKEREIAMENGMKDLRIGPNGSGNEVNAKNETNGEQIVEPAEGGMEDMDIGSNSAGSNNNEKEIIEERKQKMQKEEDDVIIISDKKSSKKSTQKSFTKRKNITQSFTGNFNAARSKRTKLTIQDVDNICNNQMDSISGSVQQIFNPDLNLFKSEDLTITMAKVNEFNCMPLSGNIKQKFIPISNFASSKNANMNYSNINNTKFGSTFGAFNSNIIHPETNLSQNFGPKINLADSENPVINLAGINPINNNIFGAFNSNVVHSVARNLKQNFDFANTEGANINLANINHYNNNTFGASNSQNSAFNESEYVPTKAYPTYLNFCECTLDVKLQNGSMVYPWQSLSNDQIHLAYDMIPDTKRKIYHSSAVNAAARSLILCGMNYYQNMPWGDQFAKFSEECTKMTRNLNEKDAMNRSADEKLAKSNLSPWALSDFMNNFMEKMGHDQFITRVFTYNVFQDCGMAISEDIKGNKPVLICYTIKKQSDEWNYSNVIAIKCEALLPKEFVLLTVDRTIEHRAYENLKRLFCNEIDEKIKQNGDGDQAKKFPLIRFQRKY